MDTPVGVSIQISSHLDNKYKICAEVVWAIHGIFHNFTIFLLGHIFTLFWVVHMGQIAEELTFAALSVTKFENVHLPRSRSISGSKSCFFHLILAVVRCYHVVWPLGVYKICQYTANFQRHIWIFLIFLKFT